MEAASTLRSLSCSSLAVATGALLAVASPALAQLPAAERHPSFSIVERHAPLVWLADSEPFMPTLPHALAFDGIDNDDDTFFDFADPDEVGFGAGWSPEQVLAGWRGLKNKPPLRVMVSCRTRTNRSTCVLNGDDFDGTADYDQVLQFWFYYFADIGVGPHTHDNEHAFLYLKGRNGECVKAVVGASHDPSTANNILVGTCESRADVVNVKNILPEHLPAHMPILVELGKHASAADLDLNGRFDLGYDANVFRHSVWGSRDTIASSFGALDLTPFEGWRSFPRSPATLFIHEGYSAQPDDYWDRYRDTIRQAKGNRYSLFPLEDMMELYRLIDAGDRSRVHAFLRDHQMCFWGKPVEVPPLDAVFRLMQAWPRQPSETKAWMHDDYRDSKAIFKSHLYPRFAARAGWAREQEQNDWYHVAIQLAEIPLPPLPKQFRGSRLFNGSSLELGGSWGPSSGDNRRKPGFRGFSAIVKGWRGNRYGYFVGLSGRKVIVQSGSELTQARLEELAAETGRTVDFLRGYPHRKSIRYGVTGGVGGELYFGRHFSLDGRVGLIVEQRNTAIDDVALALGDKSNIRFIFNLGILYGRFPSNPLRR